VSGSFLGVLYINLIWVTILVPLKYVYCKIKKVISLGLKIIFHDL